MRQFVIIGHDAPTTPDFSLDDLAGAAGRLDVLCRCVSAAVFLSHDVREDVRVHLVLGDEYTVTVDSDTVRRLNPDERSTAALIRTALEEREEAIGHVPVETSPGISLTRRGFEGTLEDVATEGMVVQLHAGGDPVVDATPPTDPVFVLSDHRDFTDAEQALIDDTVDRRLSLGPRPLHANHAITVAHNFLDTDGYRTTE